MTTEIPQRLRTVDFPLVFPRNPRSPRQLFYEDEKPVVRAEFPQFKYNEIRSEVNRRWAQLRDKTPYMILADLDKTRYEYELNIIIQHRDARSAYRIFSDSMSQDIEEKYPGLTPDEKLVYINDLWEMALPEVREHYTTLSLAENARRVDVVPENPFGFLDEGFVWKEPVVNHQPRPQVPPHMVALFMQTKPEDRECAICREVIESDMYMTPCYHLFHGFCVERCNKCPMCRETL